MARTTTTVTELLRNFSDYINRVAYRGEAFVLTRGGKDVAELNPVPVGTRLGDLPALMETVPSLSDEEAAEFEADLARARDELRAHGPSDPWAS